MMLPHREKAFDSLTSYISLDMNQNKVEKLIAGEPEIPPTPVICTTSCHCPFIGLMDYSVYL